MRFRQLRIVLAYIWRSNRGLHHKTPSALVPSDENMPGLKFRRQIKKDKKLCLIVAILAIVAMMRKVKCHHPAYFYPNLYIMALIVGAWILGVDSRIRQTFL